MSVGPKYGFMGVFWRNSEAYQTFLVLGPIDLTNGKARMDDQLQSTLRGTTTDN
jgi:hypothetical protein